MVIISLQNEKIKNLVRLAEKSAERRRSGLFVVEGVQENTFAMDNGYVHAAFYVCGELFHRPLPDDAEINFVSPAVYEKIAYRGSTEGIIGVYKMKDNHLENFTPRDDATLLIIEGVEKPGNLGAVLRSCEAFGIEAVVVTDPKADFYNPNVIRASAGCLFSQNIFSATNEEVYKYLIDNKFHIFTTFMNQPATELQHIDFQEKKVIVFGTEHSGLSDFWKNKGTNLLIPMQGKIDSLNISNAVAIVCYEVLRQNS